MRTVFQNIPEHFRAALFNKSQFRADLTLSRSPISAYKKCLREAGEQLNRWFREDEDIEILVQTRAWLIDQILTLAWGHLDWSNSSDIALMAVGGYGRAELHPCSDIDLLIVLDGDDYVTHQDNIEQFLTLLWDIGLKVSSSVRSLEECYARAKQDLTIVTNLMEGRLISGPVHLADQLEELISTRHMWPSKDYLRAKFEEQRQRHRKYNDTEYDLEPNIKSSPGGLRDLHMLGWVARRHYGTNDPAELQVLNFLTRFEHYQFKRSRAFLWKIRWALHSLTGLSEDRLLFDHQRTLAKRFGYHDHRGSLAVEQFMQNYFRTVMVVSQLKDLLLQHFGDDILNAGAPEKIIPINERFQTRNNFIETINNNVFDQHPPAILEVFVLMTRDRNISGPTANTIRLLREHRHLVDSNFRKDPRCTRLFLELMSAPVCLTSNLRRMARYGILGRYLPEFGRIIGQMQFDLFHTLTVDAHSLLLVKFLRRFSYEENRDKFPVATRIIQTIPKKELLYLAGLYHDIGKGRGGDHSILGAEDARQFCRLHGLGREDTDLITWLVKEHLTMSVIAQKQDLSDPKVIQDFARKVKTRERLKYLYLLTVADINATNPRLWNGWRASLLQQLYEQTREQLKRGIDKLLAMDEQLLQSKEAAFALLQKSSFGQKAVYQLWQHFSNSYFIRHQPEDIAWQTSEIFQTPEGQPLVAINNPIQELEHAGSKVFIYTEDKTNLFAALVAACDQLGLDIQDARIFTSSHGYSLDTFTVLEADGSAIGNNRERVLQIRNHLRQTLENPDKFPDLIKRRTPRQLRYFSREPEVLLSNQIISGFSVLDITATDRPGLLALIGKTFMKLQLQVHSAKIATFGEKVEDRFLITDYKGKPITDPEAGWKITRLLTKVLRDVSRLDAIN